MPFAYKKVLILGATSGLGKALAEVILKNSSAKVIVTGRREDRLAQFASEHGKDGRVSTFPLDMAKLDKIEGYFSSLNQAHPDIDMIIHNAGIQRTAPFYNPAAVDLTSLTDEITVNYTSVLYTLKYGLPLLLGPKSTWDEKNAAMVLVGSGIGIVPFTLYPNYGATKAAVHHLAITLKEQLRATNVKAIEIIPPATESELGSGENQPELANITFKFPALTIEEFTTAAWAGLEAGDDTISMGTGQQRVDLVEPPRMQFFKRVDDHVKDAPGFPVDRAN